MNFSMTHATPRTMIEVFDDSHFGLSKVDASCVRCVNGSNLNG